MSTLERAVAIAADAHASQVDRPTPYLLHPLRVMLKMQTPGERILAVLHDVVADSEWTLDRLRAEGFGPAIIAAIDALTHRSGETHHDFVLRAGRHPVARRVKLEDLHDNIDLGRIPCPTDKDLQRVAKYQRTIATLTSQ